MLGTVLVALVALGVLVQQVRLYHTIGFKHSSSTGRVVQEHLPCISFDEIYIHAWHVLESATWYNSTYLKHIVLETVVDTDRYRTMWVSCILRCGGAELVGSLIQHVRPSAAR